MTRLQHVSGMLWHDISEMLWHDINEMVKYSKFVNNFNPKNYTVNSITPIYNYLEEKSRFVFS